MSTISNDEGILRIIGILAIVFAVIGLYSNAIILVPCLFQSGNICIEMESKSWAPFREQVFYIMSVYCIVCYLVMLASGIQFARLKTWMSIPFIVILVAEILYVAAVVRCWIGTHIDEWPLPRYYFLYTSVVYATGTSSLGLVPQLGVLFPFWAPFLTARTVKKIREQRKGISDSEI